jgi:hypothetical protein
MDTARRRHWRAADLPALPCSAGQITCSSVQKPAKEMDLHVAHGRNRVTRRAARPRARHAMTGAPDGRGCAVTSTGRAQLRLDCGDHARVGRLDRGREHRGDMTVVADEIFVKVPARRLARALERGPSVEGVRVVAFHHRLGGERPNGRSVWSRRSGSGASRSVRNIEDVRPAAGVGRFGHRGHAASRELNQMPARTRMQTGAGDAGTGRAT